VTSFSGTHRRGIAAGRQGRPFGRPRMMHAQMDGLQMARVIQRWSHSNPNLKRLFKLHNNALRMWMRNLVVFGL